MNKAKELPGASPAPEKHQWKFFRSGGVNQVILKDGEDLRNLDQLDLKLWMALSAPTKGVEFDPATAAFIDADSDGFIRPRELIDAVRWTCSALKDPGQILKSATKVDLDAIKDPELLASAKRLLMSHGKMDAASVSVEDVINQSQFIAEMFFNGDGILTADTADTDSVRRALEDVMATQGPATDRSGKPGVDRARLDAFASQAEAFMAWREALIADKSIAPLDPEHTDAAFGALLAVEAKVDDFFARCRLIAFDPRSAAAMNREESDYKAIAAGSLRTDSREIADFPLYIAAAGKSLPLNGSVNPAWASAVAALRERTVEPFLGHKCGEISEGDWLKLKASLAPYRAWIASRPESLVASLPLDRIKAFLETGMRGHIADLIERDLALAPESARMADVEKLVRFQRDLGGLLRNYVNFADFYSRKPAIFQAGTLYLDARSCSLCLDASDEAKHASLAGLSGAFLVYCDLSRPGGQKRKIAAIFTDGDSDSVIAGRNGVFIDRSGRDWNATIAKVILNPISVRQAFWMPYKKFFRMIEEQVSKRAKTAEEANTAKLSEAAGTVATVDKVAAEKKEAVPKKLDLGTIALIGTAIGGVSALVAGIFQAIFGLGLWLPIGLIGIVLVISGPSMILASLKLRKRDIGPLLDANGWAINTQALVNIPFGATMTSLAALPPGTLPFMADPFAEKRKPWKRYVVLFVFLALAGLATFWCLGSFDRYLPKGIRFKTVWNSIRKVKIEAPRIPDAQELVPAASQAPAGSP